MGGEVCILPVPITRLSQDRLGFDRLIASCVLNLMSNSNKSRIHIVVPKIRSLDWVTTFYGRHSIQYKYWIG